MNILDDIADVGYSSVLRYYTHLILSLLLGMAHVSFYHDAFYEEAHVRRGGVGVDCYRLAVVARAATCSIVFYLYATLFAGFYGLFGVLGSGAATARGDL